MFLANVDNFSVKIVRISRGRCNRIVRSHVNDASGYTSFRDGRMSGRLPEVNGVKTLTWTRYKLPNTLHNLGFFVAFLW